MNVDGIKIGDKLEIHCYKHNGKLHRQWDEAVVLDIYDDYIVFGNNKRSALVKLCKYKFPFIVFGNSNTKSSTLVRPFKSKSPQ